MKLRMFLSQGFGSIFCYLLFLCGCFSTTASLDAAEADSGVEELVLRAGLSLDISAGTAVLKNESYAMGAGLQERTNVKICLNTVYNSLKWMIGDGWQYLDWEKVLPKVAHIIHMYSAEKTCGVGTSVFNDIKMIYTNTGQNCDTTAEESTIEGALDKAFGNYVRFNKAGIWCMELTHGGSWKGFLLIGPNEDWPSYIWCGDGGKNTCVSGGKGDISWLPSRSDNLVVVDSNTTIGMHHGGLFYSNTTLQHL
ncbi:hypothetical protein KAFR_0G03000 [Kazachstania africana CBS 2517]|uniref:Secreted protein CSS2 C-terminal domain-containing protein n=1 Tax=Kazachstania africana (strain ATCC 22294 / BCRC 22015 / CBS 2517 / CECT 1963 / NBRC 1671 / NRRL Y-8276) TaxID=1071382 RepID=H2AY82_KAZAF|nr:hypothetical protein KAFR_0G03000 [Kazachstania africana CBS 2517]CCF59332.1 hypothetical protein KAFR_0G03000 [Kazachstania africana CBS 2517]